MDWFAILAAAFGSGLTVKLLDHALVGIRTKRAKTNAKKLQALQLSNDLLRLSANIDSELGAYELNQSLPDSDFCNVPGLPDFNFLRLSEIYGDLDEKTLVSLADLDLQKRIDDANEGLGVGFWIDREDLGDSRAERLRVLRDRTEELANGIRLQVGLPAFSRRKPQ